jgi:hypothetical protein
MAKKFLTSKNWLRRLADIIGSVKSDYKPFQYPLRLQSIAPFKTIVMF